MMNDQLSFPDCASWVEISESALKNNIQVFRRLSKGKSKLGVVLKGSAYGHGTEQVFRIVQSLVDYIYVITAQDAFRMRQIESELKLHPIRILVIGALSIQEMIDCAKKNIEVVIGSHFSNESLIELKNAKVTLNSHIHIDTGLSREGFNIDILEKELEFLKEASSFLCIKGAMSHFANTEDVTEQGYAELQLRNFESGVEKIKKILNLTDSLESHIAASAATLVIPTARFTLVRVGISLYGLWPSSETRISTKIALGEVPLFRPALTWKCRSQLVKHLQKGSYVGYGCTYRAEKDLIIAVFPVGYYDGYPRSISGKAHVLINEKRCPVIGRVMMNHIIVDVTNVKIPENGHSLEATLIGENGKEAISVETIAGWAQTIHYEIVTRLGSHLKRIVVS